MGSIRKRRRRRPVEKLPTGYIAARLNLSETTVRKWRRLVSTDHVFAELRRRVLLLPARHREQLITALVDARRVIR